MAAFVSCLRTTEIILLMEVRDRGQKTAERSFKAKGRYMDKSCRRVCTRTGRWKLAKELILKKMFQCF